MVRPALAIAAILAASTTAVLWSACEGDPDVPVVRGPSTPGAVLEFENGTTILREDVEHFYPYIESIDPRMGRRTRIQGILSQHAVPVAAARRDHAEALELQRQAAESLAAAAGNYLELVDIGTLRGLGHVTPDPRTRISFPLEVARFLFDPMNLGAVSPPLECPQGYAVVAARDILRGTQAVEDLCQAYVAWFPTHATHEDYSAWWGAARENLAGRVAYIAPDFKGTLPPWLLP